MKYLFYLFVLVSLLHFSAQSQEKISTLAAISDWKRVNTLPLFFVPPPEKIAEVKIPKKPVKNTFTASSLAFAPVKEVIIDTKVLEAVKPSYFTEKGALTTPEKADFYRKAQFDERTGQPKGVVEDFYSNGDKPKFKGEYSRYNRDDESRNNKYSGTCEFYTKDGAKSVRTYNNGSKLLSENKYNENNKLISQTTYTSDGKTRKKFTEYIFDKSGNQIGERTGEYSSSKEREEIREVLTGKSIINFAGVCPQSKGVFYDESGVEYESVFQDFTCSPSVNDWKSVNGSNYENTHRPETKTYDLRSIEEGFGLLHLPVAYNFAQKSFEIEAIFEIPAQRAMSEFGIAWQVINPQNYVYFKVNPRKKTYEIDAFENGESTKVMLGSKPQLAINESGEVRIKMQNKDNKFSYFVNDQLLSFKKPPPLIQQNGGAWNIGFYFNAASRNENIVLKRIEIKMLSNP